MAQQIIQPFKLFKLTIWTAASEFTQKRTLNVYTQNDLGYGWDICDCKTLLVQDGILDPLDKISWVEPPVQIENPEDVVVIG